jgi:hypothetical protein
MKLGWQFTCAELVGLQYGSRYPLHSIKAAVKTSQQLNEELPFHSVPPYWFKNISHRSENQPMHGSGFSRRDDQ